MIYKTKKARDCEGKTAEEIMHNYQIKELNDFFEITSKELNSLE